MQFESGCVCLGGNVSQSVLITPLTWKIWHSGESVQFLWRISLQWPVTVHKKAGFVFVFFVIIIRSMYKIALHCLSDLTFVFLVFSCDFFQGSCILLLYLISFHLQLHDQSTVFRGEERWDTKAKCSSSEGKQKITYILYIDGIVVAAVVVVMKIWMTFHGFFGHCGTEG